MFQKLGDALRRFMAGRYGTDKLNMAILAAALVGMLIGGLELHFASDSPGKTSRIILSGRDSDVMALLSRYYKER